ncbi:hypothetical protein [Granulicella rosea]|uniref:hypothetical protein n=1 Tax=Granulicella rosea TaxID=474952 RepID=UPI00115EDDBB|nr:hypothetical protein [Granulicella rosea]
MLRFRNSALSMTAIALFAPQSMFMHAQAASVAHQAPLVAIRLAIEKDHIPIGQKPRVFLTFKNSSHQQISWSIASHLFRVHVEDKDSELPKTEWHRHLYGDYRSGDGPTLVDGPNYGIDIAPESSNDRMYDLTKFYNFSVPGRYTVYMEVYDQSGPQDGSGKWLRTNTVQFELAPPQ